MGNLFSRKARIYNDCPEPIRLEVVEDPGCFLRKEVTIPPRGYADIWYQTVDNYYNRDRSKEIRLMQQGQGKPEKERLTSVDIRDFQKLRLSLIDDNDGEENKKLHVRRIEGNIFLRIGIAWKVKDFGWKLKNYVRSRSKSGKKPEGEKLTEECTGKSTPKDVN
ncbi:hypothetical protein TorRG33x02_337400 [Trema orientale]|uniref:Uncharacterized protein n=1 Tax=Trema orientale TaxID=63057 RepID=A0A2P5AZC1_TREOI|nr:hypothetical protein TorRG33x02_337400 [Trema orientale]